MWTLAASIVTFILKLIAEKMIKKKLSDEEFYLFIKAFQEEKKRAGQYTTDWRKNLDDLIKRSNESSQE